MLKFRRPSPEMRLEIMPLIDVIFLLLTFFIYAMVLMVRVELLPVPLQAFESGEPAEPRPAVTLTVELDGSLSLDRQPIDLDAVAPALERAVADEPETVVYLALEDGAGEVDRAPLLQRLWDRLSDMGLDIHFVGRPTAGAGGSPETGADGRSTDGGRGPDG